LLHLVGFTIEKTSHTVTALTFYDMNIVKIKCNTSKMIKCKYKSWGEAWSLTLREEHRLRVSEKRVLREISGAKRDDVTGDWRRQHNKELCALHQILLG
jgi:hypothetical protein